jgi:succinate dehydrogenase/fumarate reductase cytochrome b subunit
MIFLLIDIVNNNHLILAEYLRKLDAFVDLIMRLKNLKNSFWIDIIFIFAQKIA